MTPALESLLALAPLASASADPLSHVLDGPIVFDGKLELWKLGLTKQTFLFFLAGLLTILFFWSYARQAGKRAVPTRWGNFVEFIIEFIRDQMVRPFMGHHGDRFVPYLASFFVYILICNVLGLVPLLDVLGPGGNTSTGNLGITAALAICAFSTYHILGIREQGLFPYLKHLFPPVPFFVLPIIAAVEIMAHVVRPCALAIRLFANMVAGHTLVAAILGFTSVLTKDFIVGGTAISLVSMVGVTALTFLELLVALIQAFVFTFLTTVFLAGAVHPEH